MPDAIRDSTPAALPGEPLLDAEDDIAGLAPARRGGILLACLVVLAVGTALRGFASVPMLLIGAVLAGGSIAIVNVLLPGLVKRDFPTRSAMMTGLFTMALCGGAAAAAALTVPIEHALG